MGSQGQLYHAAPKGPTSQGARQGPQETDAPLPPGEATPETGRLGAPPGSGALPAGLPPERGGGSVRRHPVEEVATAVRENEETAVPRPSKAWRSRPPEGCLLAGSLPAAAAEGGGEEPSDPRGTGE